MKTDMATIEHVEGEGSPLDEYHADVVRAEFELKLRAVEHVLNNLEQLADEYRSQGAVWVNTGDWRSRTVVFYRWPKEECPDDGPDEWLAGFRQFRDELNSLLAGVTTYFGTPIANDGGVAYVVDCDADEAHLFAQIAAAHAVGLSIGDVDLSTDVEALTLP